MDSSISTSQHVTYFRRCYSIHAAVAGIGANTAGRSTVGKDLLGSIGENYYSRVLCWISAVPVLLTLLAYWCVAREQNHVSRTSYSINLANMVSLNAKDMNSERSRKYKSR
jgi:hypothetical protein